MPPLPAGRSRRARTQVQSVCNFRNRGNPKGLPDRAAMPRHPLGRRLQAIAQDSPMPERFPGVLWVKLGFHTAENRLWGIDRNPTQTVEAT